MPNYGFPPNFSIPSSIPNYNPYYRSMLPFSSQPPPYSSTPTGNEDVSEVKAIEFPGFSTQVTIGGMSDANEATPNAEDSTSTRRKSTKWTTEQHLVLLSGWIKYRANSIVGRNQKSESCWGKIAEYCNEHCSFDPPRDGVSCRNTPRVNFFVNQCPYDMAYYLADGIYPSYPTLSNQFVFLKVNQTNYLHNTKMDVGRIYGVLQARFKIIREPAHLWDIADLAIIMRSCIILHNMMVEDERDTYAQQWTDYDQSEASGSSLPQSFLTEVLPGFANHVRVRSEFCDSNVDHELQADLVKHCMGKIRNVS